MSTQYELFSNWEGKPIYGFGALALVGLLSWHSSRRLRPTPPGPRKLPLVGNILSMPTSRQWEVIRDWEKEYGQCPVLIRPATTLTDQN